MRSTTSFTFSQVPHADIPRSNFSRSHGYKTTFNSGYLIPFYVDEALPGDTFKLSVSIFARMATPIVPILDNLFMDCFFFAVPIRLLWDNWQHFNGEQENPGDPTDFLIPQVKAPATGFDLGTIFDYFGIPTHVPNLECSALWARAYNLVWNEWFRDENLQVKAPFTKGDGPDDLVATPDLYQLQRRGKRHDYFTSCLPWPQKGESISIPLGTTAPVLGNGTPTFMAGAGGASLGYGDNNMTNWSVAAGAGTVPPWDNPALLVDLKEASAATINQLREAFAVQKIYERDARGGTRYTEILRSHFGVVSPDARLQRPEYLGGGSTPVQINPVTQTSGTPDTGGTPQGNLAATGVIGSSGMGFTKAFVEHCVLIGLMMVRADLSYQQGLDRMFSRKTRWDFYWPALAHIGEQSVLNKEIYAQGPDVLNSEGTPVDDQVFGYQERWAEYRYFPSKITGYFRSSGIDGSGAESLDTWHLAQDFTSVPPLSPDFIVENPPVQRVVAVKNPYPEFLFDSYFQIQCARPMPTYSVPGKIDHF
jgi:hypothetical protein